MDKVLSWDGKNLEEVVDFVKETTVDTFTKSNDKSFSVKLIPEQMVNFNIEKYKKQNQIHLTTKGKTTTTIVTDVVRTQDNLVTFTTADVLPVFDPPLELFYRDWPPAFSFMMVAHSRLWALGAGAVGLNYRTPGNALVVYFTYTKKTITKWFDQNLKAVPFIDLSEHHGSPDNLEAIAYLNGLMAFIGRNKTQVWTGSEPRGVPDNPNKLTFEFSSIMPVGIAHGNLIVETPNDIYFVSQNGVLSFGTLNVAKQFAASSNDAVDPLVREYVTSIATSNQAYRACRAFKYKSFCGFKIGLNKVLGFSAVFISYGAIFGGLGNQLASSEDVISRFLGVVTIFLGFVFLGRFPFAPTFRPAIKTTGGLIGAPILGFLFGVGWTPCIGPALGAVEALAFQESSAVRGAILSLSYCFGLGLPFILSGVFLDRSQRLRAYLVKRGDLISKIGGVFLIVIGILEVTGYWGELMNSIRAVVSDFVPVM